MTNSEKLTLLKSFLGIGDTSQDALLETYLSVSESEILNWLYSLKGSIPDEVTTVPREYEIIQVQACVSGYGIRGAEGETIHNENGIYRSFRYADMVQYIHENVIPYARIS